MKFSGKVVFITGTNRGIGRSLVQSTLDLGAKKVYASMRTPSSAPNFTDGRVVILQLDITDKNQIQKAVKNAADTEILINNAGILKPGSLFTSSIEDMRLEMDVNYFATLNMMRAFVPVLQKNPSPRIINIVSIAAYSNFPFISGYSASKAALYSATQAARIELSAKGIAVHAVNPGAIDTDMNKGSQMQMTSPEVVAASILKEVEAETLDIVPDSIGQNMYSLWRQDPAKLEQLASKMYHGFE